LYNGRAGFSELQWGNFGAVPAASLQQHQIGQRRRQAGQAGAQENRPLPAAEPGAGKSLHGHAEGLEA
jgi:hypothetical protein